MKKILFSVMLLMYFGFGRWLVMVVFIVERIGCVRLVSMMGNVSVSMCWCYCVGDVGVIEVVKEDFMGRKNCEG